MRPQQPPFSPARLDGQASATCTERLDQMVRAADELAIEIGMGLSPVADDLAAELLAELRLVVPDLARERAHGRVLSLGILEGIAEKLEVAANRHGYWPLRAGDRSAPANETQLRALVARLRLVARN